MVPAQTNFIKPGGMGTILLTMMAVPASDGITPGSGFAELRLSNRNKIADNVSVGFIVFGAWF